MYNKKPIKITVVLLLLFVFTILGLSIFFMFDDLQKSASIEIVVAPLSADITINGQPYKNMQTHKLKPGDYEITVSKSDYFESFSQEFTLQPDESKELYLELTPLPNTNWYKTHPEDAYSIDTIISHEQLKKSESLMEKYPLLTKLPIKVEYYKNNATYVYFIISYEIREKNQPVVTIKDYTGGNYNLALERIRAEGFNPDDYQIEYRDKTSEIAPAFSPE